MDMVLQSRTPKYGLGRHHPKTAAGHGRVAFLLLAIAKNGGITLDLLWRLIDIAEPMLQCRQHHIAHYIAAVSGRGRRPAHGFTVAAVQGKGHPQRAAIIAAELEPVRAPALVAAQDGNLSIVASC